MSSKTNINIDIGALRRHLRIQFEWLEVQFHLQPFAHPGHGGLQRLQANRAPRAGHVGNKIYLDRVWHFFRSCWLAKEPGESPDRRKSPRPDRSQADMACITVTDVNQNNGVIHAVHKVLMAQASSSSLARHPGDGPGRPLFIGCSACESFSGSGCAGIATHGPARAKSGDGMMRFRTKATDAPVT